MGTENGALRRCFPILKPKFLHRPVVYLDSAAATLMPFSVAERIDGIYSLRGFGGRRSGPDAFDQAAVLLDGVREEARSFINASDPAEIVFTRGATCSINLVAQSYGRAFLGVGDEVVVTRMEHHSNFVPWQTICRERGCLLRVAPVDEAGRLDLPGMEELIGPRTRLVALTHVSNVSGTVNPVKKIAELAHQWNAVVLVDGAQAAGKIDIDVSDLGCDFYAFSAQKMFGPAGVGVLWGRRTLLERMVPVCFGGDMFEDVSEERALLKPVPAKFEAGALPVAQLAGLGAAIEFIQSQRLEPLRRGALNLAAELVSWLSSVPGVKMFGSGGEHVPIVSFGFGSVPAQDVAAVLAREGIVVRAGQHCCQPLMRQLGVPAVVRVSLSLYNTREDIASLIRGLEQVRKIFQI